MQLNMPLDLTGPVMPLVLDAEERMWPWLHGDTPLSDLVGYAKQEKTPIQPDIAARDVVIRGGLNIALSDPPPYTTRGNGAVNLIAGQAVGSGETSTGNIWVGGLKVNLLVNGTTETWTIDSNTSAWLTPTATLRDIVAFAKRQYKIQHDVDITNEHVSLGGSLSMTFGDQMGGYLYPGALEGMNLEIPGRSGMIKLSEDVKAGKVTADIQYKPDDPRYMAKASGTFGVDGQLSR